MNIPCIYKITNILNNKIYVGSTKNFNRRKRQHIFDLRHKAHGNDHLQKSFNKYGEDQFKIEIIEQCDVEHLIAREQYWIDHLNALDPITGYNKNHIAGRTTNSPETVAKIIATRRKNNPLWHPLNISQRIKDGLAGLDLSHDEVTKQKISHTMKSKVIPNRSQSSYDKMANTKKNKPIPSLCKKVKCIELNIVYNSIGEAAKQLNIHRTAISMVLSGVLRKTGGYTFERAS